MFSGLHNVRRIIFRVGPARRPMSGVSIRVKKKMFLMWACFRCRGILSCSDWHKICRLFPLHIACKFKNYAAHRTPPLSAGCCKKQQKQKPPRAQQRTSSLLIPCAHGKLNVNHHQTTPKPEIHTSYHSRESRSCTGEKLQHQNENKRHSSSSAGMHVYR